MTDRVEGGPDRRSLLRDIAINAGLPYVTYLGLTRYGVATVPALVAGAVFPLAATLYAAIRQRRIQALGIIVLVATLASIIGALWFTSPFLALAKGSLITGFVGLVFLGSLATRRPLVFHIAMGQDPALRARAETLWQTNPGFRRLFRRLTAAWAAALLAEASLRLVLIPLLPISIFLPISETMWIVFFVAMTAWSWRYGQRARTRMSQSAATDSAGA